MGMVAQSFLLTRPAAASDRFAAALKATFGAEVQVLISPLMEPVFFTPNLPPGMFDALILTSETGVEAARRISAEQGGLPVRAFCVGDRTAQVAAEAGFHPRSAKGDADRLLALIRQELQQGRLLYLHGKDTRGDLAERLRSGGLDTYSAVVYDQRPCPLSAAANALLDGTDPVILPLFSPRSADLISDSGPFRAPLWIAALSPAVAEHASRLHPHRIAVAVQPEAGAMLQAVQSLWIAGLQT